MTLNVWKSGAVTSIDGNTILDYERLGDTRYPKVPVVEHVNGEPRIQKMFIRYGQEPGLKDNIEFKLDVIETVATLYGNFYRFLAYQFNYNYLMHGLNLDFLEDTLQFISTGRRDFSLLTWKELVSRNPDYIVRTNGHEQWHRAKSNFRIKKDTDLNHYISMWCSQTGGFEDMLYTTWILFGSPDSAKSA